MEVCICIYSQLGDEIVRQRFGTLGRCLLEASQSTQGVVQRWPGGLIVYLGFAVLPTNILRPLARKS